MVITEKQTHDGLDDGNWADKQVDASRVDEQIWFSGIKPSLPETLRRQ